MLIEKLEAHKTKKGIIRFIREIAKKSNTNSFVIGLSGGLDSSVVAYLLKEAIGSENIKGYHLYSETTPKEDTKHAKEIATLLKIEYKEIAIDSISKDFLNILDSLDIIKKETNHLNENKSKIAEEKIAEGNLKARIRMSILYYFANMNNSLVAGTGNKSELLIGYFTKYGDGACDIEPIGHIYKSQLQELAKDWGIPEEIIAKPPRAGLWEDQSDEEEIGFSYEVLDLLLQMIVDEKKDNREMRKLLEELAIPLEITEINSIRKKIAINQHKTEIPPNPNTEKLLFKNI
ncbi:MAG: NAD+ synthase [Methanobrevibacter sp.]|jgi:NAD+ synthase|nr:NAD+ synthase [Methanobrevibacter sp.]